MKISPAGFTTSWVIKSNSCPDLNQVKVGSSPGATLRSRPLSKAKTSFESLTVTAATHSSDPELKIVKITESLWSKYDYRSDNIAVPKNAFRWHKINHYRVTSKEGHDTFRFPVRQPSKLLRPRLHQDLSSTRRCSSRRWRFSLQTGRRTQTPLITLRNSLSSEGQL